MEEKERRDVEEKKRRTMQSKRKTVMAGQIILCRRRRGM